MSRFDQVPPPAAAAPLARGLSWVPLAAGLAATYGPVAWNYGMALYFLNYRHGFVKRGLVGELMTPFAHITRGGLVAVQLAFILAAFACTYAVLRGLLFGTADDRLLAAVLFAGPALLPHFGYLFAQPDVTLYLMLLGALAALLRLPPLAGSLLATGLACVALLAHEAFSLAFFPLLVAILWDRCRRREMPWTLAASEIAAVAAVFLAVLHLGRLKVAPAVILAEAAQRTAVPIQPQVFEVTASSFAAQRALVVHLYQGTPLRILLALTVLASLPYFTMLIRLLHRAGRARGYRPIDAAVLGMLFALPLALCYLGHDVSRWIAASAVDLTLFLSYLALVDDRVRGVLRTWAAGGTAMLWLLYELLLGPYGATGIRGMELLQALWK